MDSGDVEDMFSSLGKKLGWFDHKDIDSAIKNMSNKSKSEKKKKKGKEKKTKKCHPENVTSAGKKRSTNSSVEESESTSLLTNKCSALSCSAGKTPLTNLNEAQRKSGEINSSINDKLEVVEDGSPRESNLSASSSSTFQFVDKNSFDADDTAVGYHRCSIDSSDNSVTSSSSNICKKILFDSGNSYSLNSKLENSARSSSSSSFNVSFKGKSSPEKADDVISVNSDQQHHHHHRRNKTLEIDTTELKESVFIESSSSSSCSDDDDDDVDSLIQKLLTPHKISVGDYSTNKLSNRSKLEQHQNNSGSRLDPGNDNNFKQNLETYHENNNKDEDSCSPFAKPNSTWSLRDKNVNFNSQSESCDSSSDDDDDDDFDRFLEKMKTPAKKIPQWSPNSMKEFIVSSSDESSEKESESLPYPTNRKSPEIEKLTFSDTHARRVTQKSDIHERGSFNDSKNKIVLSPKVKVNPYTEIFKKPLVNFPQTEIKKGPAIKPSSVSTFCPETPKGIGASQNSKKHSWTHPGSKFNNESQPKPRSNEPTGDHKSFLKSLSIGSNSNSIDHSAQKYIRHFQKNRVELVSKIFKIYNDTVFEGHFPADFSIHWNNRLLTTAGHCILKSKYKNNRTDCQRTAEICLATKICDTAERVRDTLLHEMCHAAVWLVNGSREGHGRLWKAWARKANHIFPYLPLVKRCHAYAIATKYTYKCVQCGYSFGRHSKSLDTTKKVCGLCRGRFEVLLSNGTPTQTPNKFALFVKEHYGEVKKEEKCSHKDVMKILSEKFKQIQV